MQDEDPSDPMLHFRFMDSANGTKNRLNEVIIAQGRHRKWVAGELGVSRVTLHRWCHDHYDVPEAQQARCAEVLGVPQDELFPREEVLADAA